MMRTERNKEHTKEESRTLCSEFVVNAFLYDQCVRRMFCSVVLFLFSINYEQDKENLWANLRTRSVDR